MLAWMLLLIGFLTRIIGHAPNFTPITAIALFAGVYLSKKQALTIPLLLMILTDIVIGFHNTILFTWGSFLLIATMGTLIKNHKSATTITVTSLASAVLFFVVTNLGVWIVGGLYPQTFTGLGECFIAAIPFFRNTLVSSLLYSAVLFGSYELIAMGVRKTSLARVLLSS